MPVRTRIWLKNTLCVLGIVYTVALIGMAGYRAGGAYAEHSGGSDFIKFYVTSRHFLETGQVTPQEGVANYLPFFVLFMVPFAVVGPSWLNGLLFAALSVAVVLLCLRLILRDLLGDAAGKPVRWAVVPMLFALPFIHDCIVLGQMPVVVGALCIIGWWLVVRQREWPAGLAFAVAILVKPFLATLVIFLVIKRRWRAVLSTAAFGAVLGVGLPLLIMGPDDCGRAHYEYYERVLRAQTPMAVLAAESPRYKRFNNQSLAIVVKRLLTETRAGRSRKPFYVNVARLPTRAVQAVYLLLSLGIAAGTLWVGRHPWHRIGAPRANLEFAAFLLWGLFGSPIVWTFYFPLLMYPLLLLAAQRADRGEGAGPPRTVHVAWYFWIGATLSLLTEAVMLPYLRGVGIHLWASILIWAAMIVSAHRAGVRA